MKNYISSNIYCFNLTKSNCGFSQENFLKISPSFDSSANFGVVFDSKSAFNSKRWSNW